MGPLASPKLFVLECELASSGPIAELLILSFKGKRPLASPLSTGAELLPLGVASRSWGGEGLATGRS